MDIVYLDSPNEPAEPLIDPDKLSPPRPVLRRSDATVILLPVRRPQSTRTSKLRDVGFLKSLSLPP